MGWYVYHHSKLVQEEIKTHFKLRDCDDLDQDFANTWPIVSITQDLGYLFEGSLSPLNFRNQHEQVRIGVEVVKEYFDHALWTACDFCSVYERNRLIELAGIKKPTFSGESLSGVSDTLRNLGDLEKLRDAMREERNSSKIKHGNPDFLNTEYGLPGDAFDVWIRHYQYYCLNGMAERIKHVENTYEKILQEGISSTGIRFLDHGVCSGLLLLLVSTFYFNIYFGLGITPPSNFRDKEIWEKFRIKIVAPGGVYRAFWWWTTIVWATAVTAVHNIQQLNLKWPDGFKNLEPLKLEDDPLAYLGILVDCIQEWDRYTVSR